MVAVLVVMTLCGAMGGAGLKVYATSRKRLHVLMGLGFYGTGALLNIVLLQFLPLTVVLPANALTYIWTLIIAKWAFKEEVGPMRWMGVACILGGLCLLVL
ncbi:permease [Paenibacillus barcinonensis]|uniref:Permease n=2 Tax=Paenibacillus barcinonensis TaxID=198119 RepID=A0A2V4VTW5_PAEBA|nr:undecaprenyl phosphate-alpha-L-ara4N flippase subunit ArnE [Paenibacillus barcinonensis]QKS60026.1 permease [Paenibacillus barcinonensis]